MTTGKGIQKRLFSPVGYGRIAIHSDLAIRRLRSALTRARRKDPKAGEKVTTCYTQGQVADLLGEGIRDWSEI